MIRDLGDFAHRWDCRKKICISVVRTFGTGFDVGESIFWALKKSGQVFCLSSRIRKSRSHVWNISDISLSVSTGKLSHISPERQINEETDVYCV